ncbi:MAG: methyl-accepting chemotaxis protein [Desulfobulbaceae bacterium]|nr:methyl-accepting chemotaxis protein [Desulfobulbaceae bacterium]
MPPTPQQIADQIQQFLDNHRPISHRVEPDFIGLGNSLQTLYSKAAELTDTIYQAVDPIGNPESGVLVTLRGLAEECLAEFREGRQSIGTNLAAVDSIFNKLSTLITQTGSLEKIGLYLRLIGLNFGVECAHAPESVLMFSMMAKEVVQLADTISQVATGIADDCHSMQRIQQDIRSGITNDLNLLESLATDAERAVAEAVEQIEQITGKVMATLGEASSYSQEISGQVGKIVIKIQLHDSMSQRIEHIVQALTTVTVTLNESGGNATNEDHDKMLAGAWRIVTLQCGQIKRIIEEIDDAGQHSHSAFLAIDHSVESLGQSFTTLVRSHSDEPGPINLRQEDSLFFLQNALSRLSHLMADGSTMIDKLRASANQVSTMVGRLNHHMQSIEDIRFEMQLKALNAIIKAASLGTTGRTLDVLAQETKSLADQAHTFVKEVSEVHRTIDQSVKQLQTEDSSAGTSRVHGDQLDQAITGITNALTLFNKKAEDCATEAGDLRRVITTANDDLEFLPRLAEELTSHHQQLSTIADSMAKWGQQFNVHQLDEDAISLMQLYTTDQERELHAAFLGIDNNEDSTTSGDKTVTEEDVLFSPSAPAKKKDQDTLDDNIEFF